MNTETYSKHSEAREDAQRLSRTLNRDVEAVHEDCCNHDETCGRCGSQGYVYVLRYAFCNHLVTDSDEECISNDCQWREYAAFVKRDNEREAMEVA